MNLHEIMYPVAEKFISINGEGQFAGELAVFIRFRTCNLTCSYCDTRWANSENSPAELIHLEDLICFVKNSGIQRVTLTGGEPLLQENLDKLIKELIKNHNLVEIETNGSIAIKKFAESEYRPNFTLDYKLPSSNMENYMLTENYEYINSQDVIKFVIGSQEDLEKALFIIKKYQLLKRCKIYVSPVYNKIQPAEIVNFMKKNNLNQIKLQLQLHKYIWNPEKKGV